MVETQSFVPKKYTRIARCVSVSLILGSGVIAGKARYDSRDTLRELSGRYGEIVSVYNRMRDADALMGTEFYDQPTVAGLLTDASKDATALPNQERILFDNRIHGVENIVSMNQTTLPAGMETKIHTLLQQADAQISATASFTKGEQLENTLNKDALLLFGAGAGAGLGVMGFITTFWKKKNE